jgi:ADP-ribosyl-[dinitrogen reductase] hydrolase
LLRDSTSHPLRIDSLPIGNGHLGLTLCPGKKGDSVFGAGWDRDLDVDLDVIKAWGAQAVLTLIEDSEFDLLSVTGLGDAARARGMDWHHFPIPDLGVPTPEAMARWRELSPHAFIASWKMAAGCWSIAGAGWDARERLPPFCWLSAGVQRARP